MTPKEKAKELVYKYNNGPSLFHSIDFYQAKECALIAVDEILNAIDWDYYEGSQGTELNYWKEVKQEIEKL
jgi:hypothetical protein